MSVVVYHIGPSCVQCEQTKRLMRSLSIPFEDVDLRENPEKAELFKEKGYLTAPIVTFNGETWAGFKFERIKGIALKIKEREKKNDA